MKFHLSLALILTSVNISADSLTKYDDDVIIPKALQSQVSGVAESVAQENNIPLPSRVNEVVKKETVSMPEEQVDPNDVIIPKALQSTDTAHSIIQQREKKQSSNITLEAKEKEQTAKTFVKNTLVNPANKKEETCQAIQVPGNSVPNIEGVYLLNQGVERNIPVKKAMLVIERLDVDDFGYYYVTQMQSFTPTGYYGMFHYDQAKKRFFHKTYETDTTTTLDDNIQIKYDKNQIETVVSINVGKRAIIWDKLEGAKDPSGLEMDESIQKAIVEARNSYLEIYKKHPCFLDQ